MGALYWALFGTFALVIIGYVVIALRYWGASEEKHKQTEQAILMHRTRQRIENEIALQNLRASRSELGEFVRPDKK